MYNQINNNFHHTLILFKSPQTCLHNSAHFHSLNKIRDNNFHERFNQWTSFYWQNHSNFCENIEEIDRNSVFRHIYVAHLKNTKNKQYNLTKIGSMICVYLCKYSSKKHESNGPWQNKDSHFVHTINNIIEERPITLFNEMYFITPYSPTLDFYCVFCCTYILFTLLERTQLWLTVLSMKERKGFIQQRHVRPNQRTLIIIFIPFLFIFACHLSTICCVLTNQIIIALNLYDRKNLLTHIFRLAYNFFSGKSI